MRKLILAAAVLLALPTLAMAQDALTSTTSPPNPGTGSQMPEPANSLPSNSATSVATSSTPGRRHRTVNRHNPGRAMSATRPTPLAQ